MTFLTNGEPESIPARFAPLLRRRLPGLAPSRFDFYRKYEVGSSISFDIPKDFAPTPDANLKESAPVKPGSVDCKDPKNKDAAPCKVKP